MGSAQGERLVQMANQIARNLGEQRDPHQAMGKTAEHLRRFWTPAMRQRLRDYWQAGGQGLSPVVEAVLRAEES